MLQADIHSLMASITVLVSILSTKYDKQLKNVNNSYKSNYYHTMLHVYLICINEISCPILFQLVTTLNGQQLTSQRHLFLLHFLHLKKIPEN